MDAPFRLERSLIRAAGPDARAFLQNLLTQDLGKLDEAGVIYAALLSPQGKLVADMNLWANGDAIVLEADPARAADLKRRLGLYKLRARVTLEDASGALQVLWSPTRFAAASADPRFPQGELGWRAIGPSPSGLTPSGDERFDARRLAVGAPDLARDAAPEEVFALEALLEELHGVDFQKGCFVGQENVSRMKRRATTRRKFCPIAFDGPALSPGAMVHADGAELGTVRSGGPGRAIALLRLDRALAATAHGHVLNAGDRPVRLDPPPWLHLPASDGAASGPAH